MNDADDPSPFVGHDQRRDLLLLHQVKCLDSQFSLSYRDRFGCHAFLGGLLQHSRLLAGRPLLANCVAMGEGSCRIRGAEKGRATMTLAVDGANPRVAPLGGVCYPVEIAVDITSRRGAATRLEQIGDWCFTQKGNSVHTSGSSFRETRRGDIIQAVGDFKGAIYDVDGTTRIRGILDPVCLDPE